jgi:hypothetical protein
MRLLPACQHVIRPLRAGTDPDITPRCYFARLSKPGPCRTHISMISAMCKGLPWTQQTQHHCFMCTAILMEGRVSRILPCWSGFRLCSPLSRKFNNISDTGTKHEVGCGILCESAAHLHLCASLETGFHSKLLMQCLSTSVGVCRLCLVCSWAAW